MSVKWTNVKFVSNGGVAPLTEQHRKAPLSAIKIKQRMHAGNYHHKIKSLHITRLVYLRL